MTVLPHCYQCNRQAFLFSDSRCSRCTRVNPATGGLDPDEDSFEEQLLERKFQNGQIKKEINK